MTQILIERELKFRSFEYNRKNYLARLTGVIAIKDIKKKVSFKRVSFCSLLTETEIPKSASQHEYLQFFTISSEQALPSIKNVLHKVRTRNTTAICL